MKFNAEEYKIDDLVKKFLINKADSSNVEFFGYRQETETLFVQFASGSTYTYLQVDKGTYEEMLKSDNVTHFINKKLRNYYTTQKIDKKVVTDLD